MTEQLRLEKIIDMALLSDFYGPLLTEKQRQALRLFYEEDLSLGEIAADCACSRQAAHDLIKRSEALLADYAQKLGLLTKLRRQQDLLQQAEQELVVWELDRSQEHAQVLWQIWQQLAEI